MKAPSQDENQKPMYCKDKIYCGAEEYSFEELRAVRWFKQEEKKKQEQEDAKAIEGMVQGLQRPGKVLEFDLGPGKLLEFEKKCLLSRNYPRTL